MMYDIFQNIIIGAIGSILATIILYFLSQCYSFNSKKRLEYYLEAAFNYIYQIENHCSYSDENEKLARLKKLKRYFYTEESSEQNCSSIRLSLSIVKLFLQGKKIRVAFSEKNNLPYEIKDFENIIEINSFKIRKNSANNYLIQRDGLTKKQYEKLLKKTKL